jgi:hypothetical protein
MLLAGVIKEGFGSSSELVLHVPLFPIMTTAPYINFLESKNQEHYLRNHPRGIADQPIKLEKLQVPVSFHYLHSSSHHVENSIFMSLIMLQI